MATQAIEQTTEAPAAEAPAAAGSKKKLILLAVAGVLVGAAVGLFVVGPMLTKKAGAAPPAKPAVDTAAASSVVHAVENLVLNPAGTGGSRFLMVTATFQVKDGGVEQQMKDKDAEVRDRILGVLGQKTVDELSDYSKREGLKKDVLDAVAPLFPKGAIHKVFFAQFVIQ